jgi:uncharacterized protein (TIGR02186 family)
MSTLRENRTATTLSSRWGRRVVILLLLCNFVVLAVTEAFAQRRPPARQPDAAGSSQSPPQQGQSPSTAAATPAGAEARETVQADVSSRSVAVTSGFTGTEIVVFGAVDNSRQSSAEAGFYDIVIAVEGTPTRLVARKKSNNAGIWLNSASITFQSVPSYYAILSTRPLDEIADPIILRDNEIGFEHVRMTPISGWESGVTTGELEDFKSSVVRIKQRERLYVERPLGVVFIGRSLFRASVELPANIPVGPLVARVHLFREGRLLHTFNARMSLRREGFEHFVHSFAFNQPLAYGIATVILSLLAGLAATELFRRRG